MTSIEELLCLYKLALQFDLVDEKDWLKKEIEVRLAEVNPNVRFEDLEQAL